MDFQDSTYLKVNGPACTIAAMDVLTYTRIMHKHTKAQFLASTSPSPPAEISSSPPTSPVVKSATTKPEPVAFDSGNLHLPPPSATSASATTTTSASPETNAGISATTIITTTNDDQASTDTSQPVVHSSIHSRRASVANSALHHSPGYVPAPASAPLTTRDSPSPSSSSPTVHPLTAHFHAAATATSSTATIDAASDAHRRRSSAGLRKLSAGLAKLGLWRGGQHAADNQQQQHHSQSDQHQSQGPEERREGQRQAADREVEHGVPAMVQLQCECGACDWCRLRSGVLKRNGLCNVGIGGPGIVGVAAGRRDTV
ncbi:hypothetical protein IWZ03DRAFT_230116 [Phyllosticta citriasiana]|uniref:Uncharacterized protein n=2 Tax=Phyllosticta citriasiana TaxID=595635 RepID=A0ABR1KHB6_9PEZI